eukprot:93049-Hanusia_phi.AAC.1
MSRSVRISVVSHGVIRYAPDCDDHDACTPRPAVDSSSGVSIRVMAYRLTQQPCAYTTGRASEFAATTCITATIRRWQCNKPDGESGSTRHCCLGSDCLTS